MLIADITFSDSEEDYMTKYNLMLDAMPDRAKDYNNKWHTIREESVEGLKCRSMTLGTRTNNRIEYFFSHLRKNIIMRGSLQEFFERFMGTLATLRSERRHRLLTSLSKHPIKKIPEEQHEYRATLTPYAFQMVQKQIEASLKVEVLTECTVMSSGGVRSVSSTNCDCSFYTSMQLPCKHTGHTKTQRG